MKVSLSICFLLACYNVVATLNSDNKEWKSFKKIYDKRFLNEKEEIYRQYIFLRNSQAIRNHNEKYAQGLVTYSVGVNKFADQTIQEMAKSSGSQSGKNINKMKKILTPSVEVPESIDWRDYGVIRPIVDQDYCYSCWAFAAVAAVEAHIGIYLNEKNQTLSPENLIDCVYSDFECHEEMVRTALVDTYQYILDNGIDTSEFYPYDQVTAQCRFKPEHIGASIKDYVTVPEGDEEELKVVVGTLGPVSVMISVDLTFMVYRHGIYYKEDCHNIEEPYNHAVTVIGYGVEDGEEFWLVRNMWGEFFGEDGYIKMARNRDNNCGIASYATYPIV